MMRHSVLRAGAVVLSALVLVACSHSSSHTGAGTPTSAAPRRDVLVTIGSDATFGNGLINRVSDSWPQRLFHDAFARSTVFVNAADRSATVGEAIAVQVPLALEAQATVVTVWIGDLDLNDHVPAARFEADLDRLVGRLRASGARVLIGNLSRALPGATGYDLAIARVARSQGATLVDLASALSATPNVAPSSAVDPVTSESIARAFGTALSRP
ncbi:MAG TPA: SGNH/GDSL hydrolase family protein [Acidimicrobiia bacterium]